jgi:hypothetical protein
VQFTSASKSPESSDGGEADHDESGILKQIRQLQDLKRMVIQNQSQGIQYQAGCTACVALKKGNMLYVANAGDSRGVLCRGGACTPFLSWSLLHALPSVGVLLAGGGTCLSARKQLVVNHVIHPLPFL